MNPRERGFLLLTGHLGNPERKPLTVAQFRELTRRCREMEKPLEDRELTPQDLVRIGCDRSFAQRIVDLLSQKEQLQWYLETGKKSGCLPVTRVSNLYPDAVRKALALEAPGCLWISGAVQLLDMPKIALVGSRDLQPENRKFAQQVGRQAALQGYCLVSGNARGADKEAQQACLENGGGVICVVADRLDRANPEENVLYMSEEGFDLAFSPQRALSRNRVIHSLGQKVFVAQCAHGNGGTWDGTTRNLYNGWSPVFCFADESSACAELVQMGAVGVKLQDLQNISSLKSNILSYMDNDMGHNNKNTEDGI